MLLNLIDEKQYNIGIRDLLCPNSFVISYAEVKSDIKITLVLTYLEPYD